ASKSTHRTDDFVSGRRTQTCTLAFFVPVLAEAPAEITMAVIPALSARIKTVLPASLFTLISSFELPGCTFESALGASWKLRRVPRGNRVPPPVHPCAWSAPILLPFGNGSK